MPTPAITTGIIHIEMLCTPAKSNDVVSIGISVPPTKKELNDIVSTHTPVISRTADELLSSYDEEVKTFAPSNLTYNIPICSSMHPDLLDGIRDIVSNFWDHHDPIDTVDEHIVVKK